MGPLQRLFKRYGQTDISGTEKQLADAWYDSFDREEDSVLAAEREEQIKTSIWKKLSTQLQLLPLQPPQAAKGRVIRMAPLPVLRYLAAAAITGLVIAGALLAVNYIKRTRAGLAYAVIDTHNSRSKRVQLPDGSVLLLNPGSTVRFAEKFDQPQREIFMPDGEVYYDVAKDSRRPFIIHAGGLVVRVLGTSFNIRTVKGMKEQEVLVKDGKVSIQNNDKVLAELTAGKQLVYDTTDGHYIINDHKELLAERLQQGWMVFDNASFADMCLLMTTRYHAKVVDSHGRLSKAFFTTSFGPATSLTDAMKVLCGVHHVSFTIKDGQVIIN